MWLGMSVLTACEFFEFGLDIFLFGIGQFIQYKKGNNRSGVQNVWPQGQHPAPAAPPTERPSTSKSVGIGVVSEVEMSAVA